MTKNLRRNPIIRTMAVLALALGMFAATPSVAGAAETCVISANYADTMQLTVTPSTVNPGDTAVIDGSGYPPNCELEVFVDGGSIGTVVTKDDGTFTIEWNVPSDRAPGTAVVSTDVSDIEVTTNVEVISDQATPTTTPDTTPAGTGGQGTGGQGSGILPKTGSQVLPFVGVGVLLLVLGSMMVLANRKRGTAH